MKVIQSLSLLDRALPGTATRCPQGGSASHSPHMCLVLSIDPFPLPIWIPTLLCHPSAAADTPNMCLSLKCMANILPKASDPEGQREYVSVKARTTSPVSVAPKKTTFSPGCVFPVDVTRMPNFVNTFSQSTLISLLCFPVAETSLSFYNDFNQDHERHSFHQPSSLSMKKKQHIFLLITGVCVCVQLTVNS